jgi:DUF971 family protein
MSLWDSVKPAVVRPTPVSLELSKDTRTLTIAWTDGVTHELGARGLRQLCPCAECVEEWSGKRTFDVETIAREMKLVEINPVGNYAVSFTFGDLHRTGIFNWSYLRELGEGRSAPASPA